MAYPITVGEVWTIYITGSVVKHVATVEQVDPPRLRVNNWPLLKDGDFILLNKVPDANVGT